MWLNEENCCSFWEWAISSGRRRRTGREAATLRFTPGDSPWLLQGLSFKENSTLTPSQIPGKITCRLVGKMVSQVMRLRWKWLWNGMGWWRRVQCSSTSHWSGLWMGEVSSFPIAFCKGSWAYFQAGMGVWVSGITYFTYYNSFSLFVVRFHQVIVWGKLQRVQVFCL